MILAQPAAPQAGDSNSPPDRSETPEDFPWQPNESVYTYLPDCTDQGSPDIAIDAAQNLYAVWSDSRDGGSDGYFAYRPNGGAWGANVRVNDLAGTVSGAPKIAVNASGNAYVVWQDYRNGHPDIYYAYRPANGSWGASRRINSDTGTAVQRDPAIGIDDAGIASIAWTDDRNGHDDIYFTSGYSDGRVEPELRLNDDTGTAEQITPDLAVDGAGNVDVVWADGRNSDDHDIYTARRSAAGVWGENELLAAHDPSLLGRTVQPDHRHKPCWICLCGLGSPTILGRVAALTFADFPARPAACGVHSGVSLLGGKALLDITVDSDGLGYIALTRSSTSPIPTGSHVTVYRCVPAVG